MLFPVYRIAYAQQPRLESRFVTELTGKPTRRHPNSVQRDWKRFKKLWQLSVRCASSFMPRRCFSTRARKRVDLGWGRLSTTTDGATLSRNGEWEEADHLDDASETLAIRFRTSRSAPEYRC